MTARVIHLPRSDDLLAAPELAVLAVLEATANVAALALGASYPEIQDLDDADESPDLRAALALIDAASALVAAVNRYRLALVLARQLRDDRLPF